MRTALKTLFFMLLVPGIFLGCVPIWSMAADTALFSFGVFRWLAIPFWLAGAMVMLWCAWDFTFKGRGTPAPIDPPKELVITGLYRYVRNPMYVGALILLGGYIFWFPSRAIIAFPIVFFIDFHLFVLAYEEPTLRRKFGTAYGDYCKSVPRWIPKFGKHA